MNRREVEIDILEQISSILSSGLDLEALFGQVMSVLADRLGITRAALVLRDEATDSLKIAAAVGLSEDEVSRGRYEMGEGVTGQVVESGVQRVIADVTDEPVFLNRTGGLGASSEKGQASFICSPIKNNQQTVGAISIASGFHDDDTLAADARLLTIVAGNIAQAIRINELVIIEKDQWRAEADQLRENLRTKYRFGQHHRHQPRHDGRVRHDRPGGRLTGDLSVARRDRHGQGADRQGGSL